jgi:carboxyl-terminal processing protease
MRAFLVLLLAPVALLAAVLTIPSPGFPQGLVNAGFEQTAQDGSPTGWIFQPGPAGVYRFEAAPGSDGSGGRLHFAGSPADVATASAYQGVDATSYRNRIARLTARLKVDSPGAFVGLFLTVMRPQQMLGFHEDMRDRPATEHGWTTYQITGRVAPDAQILWVGLGVNGRADVTIDQVSLEVIAPDPAPPSAEAEAYLMNAIGIIRRGHINSGRADWDRIIADAREEIGGTRRTSDTYSAIRGVLGALGETHSFFLGPFARPPAAAATGTTAPVAQFALPEWRLIDGRIGWIRLPGLDTIAPGGDSRARAYTAALRSGLRSLDAMPLCGWILDLRNNGGGNMWPMMKGLDPLLGAAPFGYFVDPAGRIERWQRRGGAIWPDARATPDAPPAFPLTHARSPVAVLIGGGTASSGEMVAMAFVGRGGVRTFGAPSAGFTTGNRVITMPDDAHLVLTGVHVRDRTGRDYFGPITPDEPVGASGAQRPATQWLESQCGAGAGPSTRQ